MKKIPTLFRRNPENMSRVLDEVAPGCEWVLAGLGRATRKHDGTCCLIEHGKFYKRCTLRAGKFPRPDGYIGADFDPNTGKAFGWVPVSQDAKGDRWHREALKTGMPDGTYELCGPKVQGNPECFAEHRLVPHGSVDVDLPEAFYHAEPDEALRVLDEFLRDYPGEGIVWHGEGGEMAKIKRRDFGHPWPVEEEE